MQISNILSYNDNAATVQLSNILSTKGMIYVQIHDNTVGEQWRADFIEVEHIAGKNNNSNMFTKEDKDVARFVDCRDTVCVPPPLVPCS